METIHKYLVVPLILACLSLAFILICLAVAVTRGNPAWVRRKLRIGALIFAFQAFSGVAADAAGSCYEPKQWPVVEVYGGDSGTRVLVGYEAAGRVPVIMLPSGKASQIQLSVRYSDCEEFSFQLFQGDRIVASGPVKPLEGQDYAAVIQLSSDPLSSGVYLLKLYFGLGPGAVPTDRHLYQAYGVQVE